MRRLIPSCLSSDSDRWTPAFGGSVKESSPVRIMEVSSVAAVRLCSGASRVATAGTVHEHAETLTVEVERYLSQRPVRGIGLGARQDGFVDRVVKVRLQTGRQGPE